MHGTVNAILEARLVLTIYDSAGQPHPVDTVIDSGFNGFLTLPPALITSLGLSWLARQPGQLADGRVITIDIHNATVNWNGQARVVEVESLDAQPLLGTALMQGSELRIQVWPGGSVTVG